MYAVRLFILISVRSFFNLEEESNCVNILIGCTSSSFNEYEYGQEVAVPILFLSSLLLLSLLLLLLPLLKLRNDFKVDKHDTL